MPSNSRHSAKDSEAWRALESTCTVSVERSFGRDTFQGCFPTVKLVHIHKTAPVRVGFEENSQLVAESIAFVYRGTMAVSASRSDGDVRLFHTTDLVHKEAARKREHLLCRASPADLSGFCVLLPRVGSFSSRHIVRMQFEDPVRLSECLYAIWSTDRTATSALHQVLRDSFESLEAVYHGTCARYLTIEDLRQFLYQLGWKAEIVRPPNSASFGSASFRTDSLHQDQASTDT